MHEACESLHRLAANAEHCQKYGNLRVGEQVHIEALLILPKLRRSHQLLQLIARLDQEYARHGPQGQARGMLFKDLRSRCDLSVTEKTGCSFVVGANLLCAGEGGMGREGDEHTSQSWLAATAGNYHADVVSVSLGM